MVLIICKPINKMIPLGVSNFFGSGFSAHFLSL